MKKVRTLESAYQNFENRRTIERPLTNEIHEGLIAVALRSSHHFLVLLGNFRNFDLLLHVPWQVLIGDGRIIKRLIVHVFSEFDVSSKRGQVNLEVLINRDKDITWFFSVQLRQM